MPALTGRLSAPGAGQHRLERRDKRGIRSAVHAVAPAEASGPLFESSPEARRPRMLAEGFQSARLETRTKECNMRASRWVANP